jgi:hypothetical protein
MIDSYTDFFTVSGFFQHLMQLSHKPFPLLSLSFTRPLFTVKV